MAEPSEELPPKEDPPVVPPPETPEPEPEPQTEPDDEGRPGGADGQSVRARREYERRVAAERAAEEVRLENARLAERVRALEEGSKPKQERIATLAEVRALVDAGTITAAQGDQYIEEYILPAKIKGEVAKFRQEEKQLEPLKKAKADVDEYMQLIPTLADKSSDEFRKVAKEYQNLMAQDFPDDARTHALAAKLAFGDLEQMRKRSQVRHLTRDGAPRMPSDAGGNGGGGGSGKIDINRAPDELKNFWEQTNTPAKAREAEYKHYLAAQQRRAAITRR